MTEQQPEAFVTFDLPLKCSEAVCERRTNWGYLMLNWNDANAHMLYPRCYEHGYAFRELSDPDAKLTAQEIKEQYESIVRFVIGYHDGRGKAVVIGPCPPEDVPGLAIYNGDDFESEEEWQQYQGWHVSDRAWYVRYELNGKQEYLYVVWNFDDFVFALYRQHGQPSNKVSHSF